MTSEYEIEIVQDPSDLLPSAVVRAETALSRYPIHNLTKTEKINIHIRQQAESGQTDIYWNVSPSREYGEPRQLAYKLDTLLINRRIDKAGRPIPKLIRLGSLRDICKELELSCSGENFAGIRMALLQNASAFITAKLMYRSADHLSRRFEAAFSRYSVLFTGEELPDGQKADAVYILLNEHYWKLLNKVQFRPLDYTYQKSLTPAAHRFYELLSFPMYGTLSRNRDETRLVYSDYCLRAPQERYLERAQIQKQMYKIHRPHLKAGYLAGVRYEKTCDSEGKPDWEIFYRPGPRAKAQFAAFSGKVSRVESTALLPTSEAARRRSPELEALMERGVSGVQAQKLLRGAAEDQPILDQLAWGDFLISQAGRGKFRNPPGFYVHLVRENVSLPASFHSARTMRARTSLGHAGASQQAQRQAELELQYEDYRREEASRHMSEQMAPEEASRLTREVKIELAKLYKGLDPQTLQDIAVRTICAEIARNLKLMSFEEFSASRIANQTEPAQA